MVYFADQFNQRIRKVTPDGIITTIAGNGSAGPGGDGGPALAASLNYPGGITVDAAGNLYFNDDLNYRTRRIATNGIITTVAGTGASGFSGDGGAAAAASLSGNFGITLDLAGNLFTELCLVSPRRSPPPASQMAPVSRAGAVPALSPRSSAPRCGDGRR